MNGTQELGIYGGGLLADEMGMGKTIQMIALMVSEPGRPNLVIAYVLPSYPFLLTQLLPQLFFHF